MASLSSGLKAWQQLFKKKDVNGSQRGGNEREWDILRLGEKSKAMESWLLVVVYAYTMTRV
jgi:hypothetical protein